MIVKNLEKKEKSTVSFDVLCDAAEFEKAVNTVYLKNKSKIFVQGFRKGKAPRMVIEGMYGKDVFYEDAVDELAPTAFDFAVEQEQLRNIGRPTVQGVDISDAKELTLTFVTAVWPEVTLGQYKGVEAPRAEVEITEEQIDGEIEKMRKRNARIAAVERPAQNGDTAVIDYEGSVDGVPFDGGKGEGYGLSLGSNTFIPGFEEQVVGMSAGEEKDINVTFPEEYHEPSLAGKAAVFHVKVSEVKEEQLPELDDEFAKDVSEFDTLAEYRTAIKGRMEASEKDAAEADYQSALIAKAGDDITADIPDAMVEEQIDSMIREYDQNLQMNGMNLELYMKYMGLDANAFREQCRPTAERRVKTELLLDKVAEVEDIQVSEEDIAAEYEKVADQYDADIETVKGAVPQSAVIGDIKARRAAEIIFSTGIPTAPEAAPAEAEEEAKPKKKTTKKSASKKAAPAEEPAAEDAKEPEAGEEAKPAKKTTKKPAAKKEAPAEEPAAEAAEEPAAEKKPAKKTTKKPAAKKDAPAEEPAAEEGAETAE